MKVGRPTKLSQELLNKTWEYIDECEIEIGEFHKTRSDKSNTYERFTQRVNLPTVEGLACHLRIVKATLYDWVKEKENDSEGIKELKQGFSYALAYLKQKQKKMLIDYGGNGDITPTITKLMLMSNHDMMEKKDVTSDGKAIEGNKIIFEDFS